MARPILAHDTAALMACRQRGHHRLDGEVRLMGFYSVTPMQKCADCGVWSATTTAAKRRTK